MDKTSKIVIYRPMSKSMLRPDRPGFNTITKSRNAVTAETPNEDMNETLSHTHEPDDVDEDLLALPPPPPNPRLLIFVVAILLMSAIMMVWFFPELRYFLATFKAPVELGEAADIDPSKLIPDTLAEVDGFPLIQRTLTYKEGVKWFMMSDNMRKFFPLAGQSHLYVQWAETAEHKAYRDPETNPGVLGPPSHFRGHLTTRKALGPNYNQVWVFYDCLKYHYLGRCNRCLGRTSMDECRNTFVCAESNGDEACGEILSHTESSLAKEIEAAEKGGNTEKSAALEQLRDAVRENNVLSRSVRLEELGMQAARLHDTAAAEKNPLVSSLEKTRGRILTLRAKELRVRATDALRTVSTLKDTDKEKLRALRAEWDKTQAEETSLVKTLRTMKVLVQLGDGVHRWKKRTQWIMQYAALLSPETAKKAAAFDPASKNGPEIAYLLNSLESEIADVRRARYQAEARTDTDGAADTERDTDTAADTEGDTEAATATTAATVPAAAEPQEALALPNDPAYGGLIERLTALKTRLRAMEIRLGEVLPGRLPDLEKWALKPDVLGNVPDALMESRVISNIADIERMTASISEEGDADGEPDFTLARTMNDNIDKLAELRARIKKIPETTGFFELQVSDLINELDGIIKPTMPLKAADDATRRIDRIIAEMSTHQLFLSNLKGAPEAMQQLGTLVSEETLDNISAELEEIVSTLDPGDFVLIDGEIPMDKLWVVLLYLALIAMIVVNTRKLKRFIDAYRK